MTTYALLPLVARQAEQREACRKLVGLLLADRGTADPLPAIGHSPKGQPLLTNHPELCISLSHCRTHVAAALSDSAVGIDIEGRRRISPTLLRRVLSADEYQSITQADDPDMQFLRLWTAKEAFLKQQGTGIVGFGSLVGAITKANELNLRLFSNNIDHNTWLTLCHNAGDEVRYVAAFGRL
ncbi:MAG: 4'-phosphopantetheinyl transferase superfamily protein [Bacteroidales bacterium]|nr:4'-phosphopantetheinyl transferase superfamily protein [Bacteroidales bacterium]